MFRFKTPCLLATGFLAALILLALFRGAPVFSAAGGPAAFRNGDADCDGRINIGDAVHIIRYLFQGGEPPCALADNSADLAQVVDELKQLRSQAAACCSRRPPGPEDMVSITTGFALFLGDTFPYKVPDDRWLVITDIDIQFTNFDFRTEQEDYFMLFEQHADGKEEFRTGREYILEPGGSRQFQFHSTVGMRFRPGSSIIIRASTELHQTLLAGYLSRI